MRLFEGPTVHFDLPSLAVAVRVEAAAWPKHLNADFFLAGAFFRSTPTAAEPWLQIVGNAPRLIPETLGWLLGAVLQEVGARPARVVGVAYQRHGYIDLKLSHEHDHLIAAQNAWRALVPLVEAARNQDADAAAAVLDERRRACQSDVPYHRQIVACARRRGVEVTAIAPGAEPVYMLGSGARQRRIRASVTDRTSRIANQLASDKVAANALMRRHGLPTPDHRLVRSLEEAKAAAANIGYPVVVKPADADKGAGVTAGVLDADRLSDAYRVAAVCGRRIIVEAHIAGDDHRITVMGGAVVSAQRLIPAHVEGDGRRTVQALIEAENARRAAERMVGGDDNAIVVADETSAILAAQGLSMLAAPPAGAHVRLRSIASTSQGGTDERVTARVHPDNRLMAERAASAVGLDAAGVDFITADISRSHLEVGGAICEINPHPGLGCDEIDGFVDLVAPEGSNLSIPCVAVLGRLGSDVVGELERRLSDHVVGVASGGGVRIGRADISKAPSANRRGARIVLEDAKATAAVIEVSVPAIADEGLGFDRCFCLVVHHIPPGMEETTASVLDLLLRRCSGLLILNGEDEQVRQLAERASVPVLWATSTINTAEAMDLGSYDYAAKISSALQRYEFADLESSRNRLGASGGI